MNEVQELSAKLKGSLLLFTQVFYEERTGREFKLSHPVSQESHYITICRKLTQVKNRIIHNLMINIPPGLAKSELAKNFIAWCFTHYPDCQFPYASYGHSLAKLHTNDIRSIIDLPLYKKLFGFGLDPDNAAKDDLMTSKGGHVKAFSLEGGITGHGAGLPHCDRFSGAFIIDDPHDPNNVNSDVVRLKTINNYFSSVLPRIRGRNVPIVLIAQRTREDDLCGHILQGKDGLKWDKLILPAEDINGNLLCPELLTREFLDNTKKYNEYIYYSHYMQDPVSPGSSLYDEEDFVLLDREPDCLLSFITVDTAETDKTYNDATVFSFWGLYKLSSGVRALHWINCVELWVNPSDLEKELSQFYNICCRYPVPPSFIAIEKKSTGVTLSSVLKEMRGIKIRDIERTRASGNKTTRFIEMQRPISERLISFPRYGNHVSLCIEHMKKITANNTHARDDIADTAYDAIKMALIDKELDNYVNNRSNKTNDVIDKINLYSSRILSARNKAYGFHR